MVKFDQFLNMELKISNWLIVLGGYPFKIKFHIKKKFNSMPVRFEQSVFFDSYNGRFKKNIMDTSKWYMTLMLLRAAKSVLINSLNVDIVSLRRKVLCACS